MRKAILACIVTMLLICIAPVSALAYDKGGITYNDNDFYKLQAFLNTMSDDGLNTNGQRINPAYDPDDPTTWLGITWTGSTTDRRPEMIGWADYGLKGDLDLSGFASLQRVAINQNPITSVKTGGNTELNFLNCKDDDQLTALDASGLTKLDTLYCNGCASLTSLDVSGSTSLVMVDARDCRLDTLDLTGCTALQTLEIENNRLASIDLTECTSMGLLNIKNNALKALDVSGLPLLTILDCEGNVDLATLKIKGATNLMDVNCPGCALSTLDASGLTLLTGLKCSVNDIETLDITGDTELQSLECDTNKIQTLSVAGLSKLTNLNCSQNELSAISGIGDTALQILGCSHNHITELDVSGMDTLAMVACDQNNLQSLDVSGNTTLMYIVCSDNKLTSFNTEGDTGIVAVLCNNNHLTELDLSDSTGLAILDATGNRLSTIKAVVSGKAVNLNANGGGYVELYNYMDGYYAYAVPCTEETFINWTKSGTEVSTAAKYGLTPDTEYDLTANFTKLEIASSVADGKIFTGGRITLTPSLGGGVWEYDSAFLSRNGNTFTALKAGTTLVRYVTEEESVTYEITLAKSELPATGQDFTLFYIFAGTAAALLVAGMAMLMVKRRRKCFAGGAEAQDK